MDRNSRMVAVVLAAGKGTRCAHVCRKSTKALIEIEGRTLLEHNLELLQRTPVRTAVIVTDARNRGLMESRVAHLRRRMDIRFVVQRKRLGTGHAVRLAESAVDNNPFLYLVADNFTNFDLNKLLRQHRRAGADATIALKPVEEPWKFGVAQLQGDRVLRLVEKAEHPPTNLSFTSMAVFEPVIFRALRKIRKDVSKKEYFITDAINEIVRQGGTVSSVIVDTWRLNINTVEELEEARKLAASLRKRRAPRCSC